MGILCAVVFYFFFFTIFDVRCLIVGLFNHCLGFLGAFFLTLGKELYVHSTVFLHNIVALTWAHRVPRGRPFISSPCRARGSGVPEYRSCSTKEEGKGTGEGDRGEGKRKWKGYI
jgi:hypothetical protein